MEDFCGIYNDFTVFIRNVHGFCVVHTVNQRLLCYLPGFHVNYTECIMDFVYFYTVNRRFLWDLQ